MITESRKAIYKRSRDLKKQNIIVLRGRAPSLQEQVERLEKLLSYLTEEQLASVLAAYKNRNE